MKQLILVPLLITRYSHSRFFTKDPQLERHHALYDPCRLSITESSLKKKLTVAPSLPPWKNMFFIFMRSSRIRIL